MSEETPKCRRCTRCDIKYPCDVKEDVSQRCDVCDGGLNYLHDVEPHEDWLDRVGKGVWGVEEGWKPLYGGTTAMERFLGTLESLAGAEDFVFECGPYLAPAGQDR